MTRRTGKTSRQLADLVKRVTQMPEGTKAFYVVHSSGMMTYTIALILELFKGAPDIPKHFQPFAVRIWDREIHVVLAGNHFTKRILSIPDDRLYIEHDHATNEQIWENNIDGQL